MDWVSDVEDGPWMENDAAPEEDPVAEETLRDDVAATIPFCVVRNCIFPYLTVILRRDKLTRENYEAGFFYSYGYGYHDRYYSRPSSYISGDVRVALAKIYTGRFRNDSTQTRIMLFKGMRQEPWIRLLEGIIGPIPVDYNPWIEKFLSKIQYLSCIQLSNRELNLFHDLRSLNRVAVTYDTDEALSLPKLEVAKSLELDPRGHRVPKLCIFPSCQKFRLSKNSVSSGAFQEAYTLPRGCDVGVHQCLFPEDPLALRVVRYYNNRGPFLTMFPPLLYLKKLDIRVQTVKSLGPMDLFAGSIKRVELQELGSDAEVSLLRQAVLPKLKVLVLDDVRTVPCQWPMMPLLDRLSIMHLSPSSISTTNFAEDICPNLTSLILSSLDIDGEEFLKLTLTKLDDLRLIGCNSMTDAWFRATEFPSLVNLQIIECRMVTGSGWRPMPKLRWVDITHCDQFGNAWLAEHPMLATNSTVLLDDLVSFTGEVKIHPESKIDRLCIYHCPLLCDDFYVINSFEHVSEINTVDCPLLTGEGWWREISQDSPLREISVIISPLYTGHWNAKGKKPLLDDVYIKECPLYTAETLWKHMSSASMKKLMLKGPVIDVDHIPREMHRDILISEIEENGQKQVRVVNVAWND